MPETHVWTGVLLFIRAILGTAIPVVNAPFERLPQGGRHVRCPDCQIAFHPVAAGPAGDAPAIQIRDHRQIHPAFAGPDTGYVTGPFLIWGIGSEILVQQVWGDMEDVVAAGCHLVFAYSEPSHCPAGHVYMPERGAIAERRRSSVRS
jgi:hypothetical protein